MAALTFPATPSIGDVYPADPGTSGIAQYEWDGTKWNAVPTTVSLGAANQDAFNEYRWPSADGSANYQLTTDGLGNLSWALAPSSAPSLQVISLLEPFDGVTLSYTLVEAGSSTPFSPSPSTNIVVFLGGIPQIPAAAYNVTGNTIFFTEAPLPGSTFYAISTVASF